MEHEYRSEQEDTVSMEQLEEDAGGPERQEVTTTRYRENPYNMIVNPAILYGMDKMSVTSSHAKRLEVSKMKMY